MKTSILKFNTTSITIVFILLFFMGYTKPLYAQNVGINPNGSLPKSSTILDLSTGNNGTLGFLPPKVKLTSTATGAVGPITNPSNGLIVYDSITVGAVTQGFYYWSGSVATGKWVRLQDKNSSTQPYGYNTQYVAGTKDTAVATTTIAKMPEMSITFTPVHSVVFLNFSASGITNLSTTSQGGVFFATYVNGALAASPYIPAGTGYGSSSLTQAFQTAITANDQIAAWNVSIYLPIHVTAGTSVTIAMYWEYQTGSPVENYVSSLPAQCHRTMVITD